MFARSLMVLAAIALLAGSSSAQTGITLAGSVGYYRASLDKLDQGFEGAKADGAVVQNTNGGFIVSGIIGYRVSPYFTWRLSFATWQDQASGERSSLIEQISIINTIRLNPVLLGFQFYLLPEKSPVRVYIGGSAGMVLIKNSIRFSFNAVGFDPASGNTSATGSDFMAYPFVGVQLYGSKVLSLYFEGGYKFGKYSVINTETTTGTTERQRVSLNGIIVNAGVAVDL